VQEVGSSNPLAPTGLFADRNLSAFGGVICEFILGTNYRLKEKRATSRLPALQMTLAQRHNIKRNSLQFVTKLRDSHGKTNPFNNLTTINASKADC